MVVSGGHTERLASCQKVISGFGQLVRRSDLSWKPKPTLSSLPDTNHYQYIIHKHRRSLVAWNPCEWYPKLTNQHHGVLGWWWYPKNEVFICTGIDLKLLNKNVLCEVHHLSRVDERIAQLDHQGVTAIFTRSGYACSLCRCSAISSLWHQQQLLLTLWHMKMEGVNLQALATTALWNFHRMWKLYTKCIIHMSLNKYFQILSEKGWRYIGDSLVLTVMVQDKWQATPKEKYCFFYTITVQDQIGTSHLTVPSLNRPYLVIWCVGTTSCTWEKAQMIFHVIMLRKWHTPKAMSFWTEDDPYYADVIYNARVLMKSQLLLY